MMHYGYGFGGGFGWLIFLALIVFLVYIFIIKPRKSGGIGRPPQETPLDILKKRYAKGEITKEEFESLKKDLQS
jgi:putative membrane protein